MKRFAVAVLILAGYGGCEQQSQDQPVPHVSRESEKPAQVFRPVEVPAVADVPIENVPLSLHPPPSIPLRVQESVSALEIGYFRTEEAEDRAGTLRALAERDNAEAAHALLRIFRRERQRVMRMEVLTQLGDMAMDTDLAPKLELLSAALLPEQPREMRLAALGVLSSVESPQVREWLRALSRDSDTTVRQAAAVHLSALD